MEERCPRVKQVGSDNCSYRNPKEGRETGFSPQSSNTRGRLNPKIPGQIWAKIRFLWGEGVSTTPNNYLEFL